MLRDDKYLKISEEEIERLTKTITKQEFKTQCSVVDKLLDNLMSLYLGGDTSPESNAAFKAYLSGWEDKCRSIRNLVGSSNINNTTLIYSRKSNINSQYGDKKFIFDKPEMKHKDPISCIIGIPREGNTFIASGGKDKAVNIWDEKFTLVKSLHEHTKEVTCVYYFEDNKVGRLASGSLDGTVVIYDTCSFRVVNRFNSHSSGVNCIKFIPSLSLLVTGASQASSSKGEPSVRLWNLKTNKEVKFPKFDTAKEVLGQGVNLIVDLVYFNTLAIVPNRENSPVHLFDYSNKKWLTPLRLLKTKPNCIIQIDKYGEKQVPAFITASADRTLVLYLKTAEEEVDKDDDEDDDEKEENEIFGLPGSRLITLVHMYTSYFAGAFQTSNSDHIIILDMQTRTVLKVYESVVSTIHSFIYIPRKGEDSVVSMSSLFAIINDDSKIHLVDQESGQEVTTLGLVMSAYLITQHKETDDITLGFQNGKIQIWRSFSTNWFEILTQLRGHQREVTSLSHYYPNKSDSANFHLVSASADSTVKIWDLKSKACLGVFNNCGEGIKNLNLLRIDNKLYTMGLKVVKEQKTKRKQLFINAPSEDSKFQFSTGHTNKITGVVFIKSGDTIHGLPLIATCSEDTSIKFWDLTTSAEDNTRSKSFLTIDQAHKRSITCMMYIPPNETAQNLPLLVSGSDDKTVSIWNINSLQQGRKSPNAYFTFTNHESNVKSLGFIPRAGTKFKKPLLVTGGMKTCYIFCLDPLSDIVVFTIKIDLGFYSLQFIWSEHTTRKMPILAAGSNTLLYLYNVHALKVKDPDGNIKANVMIYYNSDSEIDPISMVYIPPESTDFNLALMAIGTKHGVVKIWDMDSKEEESRCVLACQGEKRECWRDMVNSLVFIRKEQTGYNSPLLVSGSADRSIRVYDIKPGKPQAECIISLLGHSDEVRSLFFIPPSDNITQLPLLLSVGSDSFMKMWNLNSLQYQAVYRGHKEDGINSIIHIPSADTIYKTPLIASVADREKEIFLWDMNSSEGRKVFSFFTNIFEITTLAFIPPHENDFNLPLLVSGDKNSKINFWNLNSQEPIEVDKTKKNKQNKQDQNSETNSNSLNQINQNSYPNGNCCSL